MNTVPFINLARQYQAYREEIDESIARVVSSGIFIGGNEISSLESELAGFCGASHAIGCSNGTDALMLALMAIDVQPGDEIIVPSFTFVATAEVVALLGCVPVFADISEDDALMDAEHVKTLISDKTRAIIPVGLFGQCPDMDVFNEIARNYDIAIIEDAAQSFGATYKGRHSCRLSRLACTSFFPAKPLGCYGDGGAIFTTDESLAAKIFELRNHGQSSAYHYSSIGINGRLDALQAAILRTKLLHFKDEMTARNMIAGRYRDELTPRVKPLMVWPDRLSSYAQFTLVTDKRDELRHHLQNKGIPSAIYYPRPLHQQTIYEQLARSGPLPVTDRLCSRVLSLPMCAFLAEGDQIRVIEAVNSFFD